MSPELELDVGRVSLYPGEEVRGSLELRGAGSYRRLEVVLQGEEVLGASSLLRSYVFPVLEERLVLAESGDPGEGRFQFSFLLPPWCPPSYASPDVRCHYFLKARLHVGGLTRDTIRRLHLAVLPPPREEADTTPHRLVLEEGGAVLEVSLNRTLISAGESLNGSLLLDRRGPDAALPGRLTFRIAAIEESKEPAYKHRRVLWLATHDVEVSPEVELPLVGSFEFPLAEDAPFSGEWGSFRLHYGFRVGMSFAGGRHVRRSLPIEVVREYIPLVEEARWS